MAPRIGESSGVHTMPVAPRTTPLPGTSSARPRTLGRPDAARPVRVLIIDDEREAASSVAQAFAEAHVEICLDSETGLGRAATEPWDLILCDMMMPGLTGRDVYERLAVSAPDKIERVVFVSGGGFTPEIRAFLDRRGPRLLTKPASLAELRALLA